MFRSIVAAVTVLLIAGPAWAGCESVKSSIAAKLQAKKIVADLAVQDAKADVAGGKVVGNCEGGAKVIVYRKGAAK